MTSENKPITPVKERIEQMLTQLRREPSGPGDFDVAYGIVRFCTDVGLLEQADLESIADRIGEIEVAWDKEVCAFLRETKGEDAVNKYRAGATVRRNNRKRSCV